MKTIFLLVVIVTGLTAQGADRLGVPQFFRGIIRQEGAPIRALAAQQEAPDIPADWFCTPTGWMKGKLQTTEHPCHCKPMATPESSCEERAEDRACSRYCTMEKCSCPIIDCK